MRTTAETWAGQCYLAHPRMYPITSLVEAAIVGQAKRLLTPSLSELSALDGIGPLSAILEIWSGHSQRNPVLGDLDSVCNWTLLLGRACTK